MLEKARAASVPGGRWSVRARHRGLALAGALLGAWLALCPMTRAETPARVGPRPLAGVPAIPPGREAGLRALFAPLALGQPVSDGWRMENLSVDGGDVGVELRHTGGARVTLVLTHPMLAGPEARPVGALRLRPPESEATAVAAAAAVERLLGVVARNATDQAVAGLWMAAAMTSSHRSATDRAVANTGGEAAASRSTARTFLVLCVASVLLTAASLLWLLRRPRRA